MGLQGANRSAHWDGWEIKKNPRAVLYARKRIKYGHMDRKFHTSAKPHGAKQ